MGGHLWRVARYAALLCERSGTSMTQCARVNIGAFLHDLGKIGVPDAVMRKPTALTDDAYGIVKTHPDIGARLLAGHPLAAWVRDAVQMHHERPDGQGYPRGLRGADIPFMARVVGICDAFDAMTSSRPYRSGQPIAQALHQIEAHLGRQFDEPLGRHFIALGADGLLDHIVGHSDDGIPLQQCLMCGPTLVMYRAQRAGEALFCRNCGGEYVLQAGDESRPLQAVATGRKGGPADLAPVADMALIQRFVQDTAQHALQSCRGPLSPSPSLKMSPANA